MAFVAAFCGRLAISHQTPTGPGMITTMLRGITLARNTSSSTPTTLTSRNGRRNAPTTRRNKLQHRNYKVADKSFWLKHHLKLVTTFLKASKDSAGKFRRYQRRF